MDKLGQRCHIAPAREFKPPLWVRLTLMVGDIFVRHFFPYAATGIEHYTASPSTLVVSNHRHDVDGPLLGSALLRRRHGLVTAPFPHFVAREDLFEKGFLAHYLRGWPAGLRRLLVLIGLRWFLNRCGAFPLQRTHERNVAEVLQDVRENLGDMCMADALRPTRQGIFADMADFDPRTTRISNIVRGRDYQLWRQRYGYRHLRREVFHRLKPHLRTSIDRQLALFTNLLECGHMLILEPEGALSLDGSLRRPRAAMHVLINHTQAPVRVLPVSLTYDTLTTGKTRTFVDIQPEMTDLKEKSRDSIDQSVMTAIRAGCRITGGQLSAGFFLFHSNPENDWTGTTFVNHIHTAVQNCETAGLPMDPCLLARDDREERARDILKWGVETAFIERRGNDLFRVLAPDMPPPWLPDGPPSLIGYLRAELLEIVGSDLVRQLGLAP